MKKGYTQVSNMIIRNTRLPNPLFRTFVALKSYAYGKKTTAFPSQLTLAKDIGKTRETINRHISALEKLGFIEKKKKHFAGSNKYTICDEDITNSSNNSKRYITPKVRNSSPQKLQKPNTNNTNNKTKKKGLESLRKTVYESLRLKTNK